MIIDSNRMKWIQLLSCCEHTGLAASQLVCTCEVVSSYPFFWTDWLQTWVVVSNGIHHREGHKYHHLVVHDVYDGDDSCARQWFDPWWKESKSRMVVVAFVAGWPPCIQTQWLMELDVGPLFLGFQWDNELYSIFVSSSLWYEKRLDLWVPQWKRFLSYLTDSQ